MDRVVQLTPQHRCCIWLASGLILWLGPVGSRAPGAAIAVALPAAIACFARAHKTSIAWSLEDRLSARSWALQDATEAYSFAVEEEFSRGQILAQLFPGSAGSKSIEPVQDSEPVQVHEPLNPASSARFSGSRTALEPAEPRYTCHELKEREARQLIAQLLAQGLNQASIIEQLWGVKKGGSRAYKSALAQYRSLQGEG